ncbi:MAG: helix-turn-helix transcriptional regulator [Pirellulales bacterium]
MSIVDWNSFTADSGFPLSPVPSPHGHVPHAAKDDDDAEPGPTERRAPEQRTARDKRRNGALHRLIEVREQQGVTQRNVAHRLGLDIRTVRAQEDPKTNLSLRDLYAWQEVLEVPVADLLVDDAGPLSPVVHQRAQLVRVMKTVGAMLEKADSPCMKRFAQMLVEQLCEIMPELKEVGPWHTVGQRRTTDEVGRTGSQTIPDDFHRQAQN